MAGKVVPEVLIICKPPAFDAIGEKPFTSNKYRFLKAYESPLPLRQFIATHAGAVQAILCNGTARDVPVTADLLRLLPAVRLVVTASSGVNHIDVAECRRRGIAVANVGKVYTDDVADLAVGLLLDVWWNISAGNRFVRGISSMKVKGDSSLGFKLRGKQIGIVGLGNIGAEVAKRLEAFGCIISYYSRTKKPHVSYPFYDNVCKLAANCQALIVCCGLTDQTRHMINKEVLSALGQNGVLVNVGCGPIINEKELVRALVAREIAGAGLDVFESEPNVPKELFVLDNVVLSPHTAVFTPESLSDASDLIVRNLEAFFSGKHYYLNILENK